MTDDLVKAEVTAVLALKRGVERYAERVRGGLESARSELDAADRKAQDVVERRRADVKRREQELRSAEAALRHCQENCGGLQQVVAKASQALAEAQQRLDRARKGAQLIAEAKSGFTKAAHTADSIVGEHHSVASAALGNLEGKLRQISGVYPAMAQAVADIFLTKAGAEMLTRAVGAAVGVHDIPPDPMIGNAAESAVESLKHGAQDLTKKLHHSD